MAEDLVWTSFGVKIVYKATISFMYEGSPLFRAIEDICFNYSIEFNKETGNAIRDFGFDELRELYCTVSSYNSIEKAFETVRRDVESISRSTYNIDYDTPFTSEIRVLGVEIV